MQLYALIASFLLKSHKKGGYIARRQHEAAVKIQRIARGRSARLVVQEIRQPTNAELVRIETAMSEARSLASALREEGREEEAVEAERVVKDMELAKYGRRRSEAGKDEEETTNLNEIEETRALIQALKEEGRDEEVVEAQALLDAMLDR